MRVSPRRSFVALSAAGVLTVAACGGSEGSNSVSAPTNSEPATTEASSALEPVMVPTASGGQLDFNSLRGQDVLLWFWAPW